VWVTGAEEQIKLTDEDLRIMKVAVGGFEQCYNAQAAVDTQSTWVMVPLVTAVGNDKEQVEPMVSHIRTLPEGLNQPEQLLAATGFFSQHIVQCCLDAGVEPLIAVGCDAHHPNWRSRFDEPAPLKTPASHVEQMKHALKTRAGLAGLTLRN
jgi:hypothetical protein